jgi:nucleoside-diphosphate-sugar epimerase
VRPEIVYHLSGVANADPGIEFVRSTFESLLTTTVHLLLAAKGGDCRRVVLVGSMEEPAGC